MKIIAVVFATLLLAACGGMPKHAETTTDLPAVLAFSNLPPGSVLVIDNNEITVGSDTDKLEIVVSAGSHNVIIRQGMTRLYEREVFVERGTTREIRIGM